MESFYLHYIVLTCLVLGTISIVWLNLSNLHFEKECRKIVNISENQIKFNAYLKKFNKSYFGDEYMERFGHFMKSLEEISRLNDYEETGAKHGLTKYSDLSQEEFHELMHNPAHEGSGGYSFTKSCVKPPYHIFLNPRSYSTYLHDDYYNDYYDDVLYRDDNVEDAIDWRDHKIIGPVLQQKKCLACWAFSIVGLMESMEAKQGLRAYTERSIQELIDCLTVCNGCDGGNVVAALRSMCRRGLEVITENEYPLKLMTGPCQNSTIRHFAYDGRKLSWFTIMSNMNETDMIRTIFHHGPIIAVVNAKPWQHYTSGVIQRACHRNKSKGSIDHVIQIIGYDLKAEVPYFIIKNSWGEDFGEKGYVRVAIHGNVCGVSDEIAYLQVN